MPVSQPAAAVIGPGRVGRAIRNFYHPPAPLYGRGTALPRDLSDVPVWVCTTNDGLERVLEYSAPHGTQQRQLIFIQNGMLLPWLQQHQLEFNTQVLLYMSAADDGKVTDGLRTAVCGPWAQHVAHTLTANDVRCTVIEDWQEFRQLMLVKLLWSCIFWLLSAGLGGKPVGLVAKHHTAEVSELVAELLPLGQQYLQSIGNHHVQSVVLDADTAPTHAGLAPGTGTLQHGSAATGVCSSQTELKSGSSGMCQLGHDAVLEQLLSYSFAIAAAVPSDDMARREFAWRNGFFLGLPSGRTPRHCDWLAKAGCSDLLNQLPIINS